MKSLLAILVVIFGVQYWFFRSYAEREILWAYPGYYDQVFYLADAYTAYDETIQHGILAGTAAHLTAKRPTGWLMPPEAALLFHAFGPSRLTALTVHFLHLIVFETALALTLYWLTGSVQISLIGLGLFLCSLSRLLPIGGLLDFRMESSALSVFGIALCLAIRSRFFQDRRWAALTGAVAGYLICFRFITAVYFGAVFVTLLAVCVWRKRASLAGLLLAASIAGVLAGPVLLHHQESIRAYYLPAHVTGGETQVRIAEQGIRTWVDNLVFYPRMLLMRHLAFLVFPLAALVVVGVPLVLRRRCRRTTGAGMLWEIGVLASAFLFTPLLVLTVDTTKAEQVAGIMIPGLLWLLLLPLLWRRPSTSVLLGLVVMVLCGWLMREGEAYRRHVDFWDNRITVEQVLRLNAQLARLSAEQHLASPLITINELADYLSPDMLTVLAFEQTGYLIKPRAAIQMGVLTIPKENAIDGIRRSDFAILAKYPGPVPPPQFPFNLAMKEYAPELIDFARQQMHEAGEYTLYGQPVLLFSRR